MPFRHDRQVRVNSVLDNSVRSSRMILGVTMGFGLAAMGALYLDLVIVGFVLLGIFTVAGLNAIRALISDEAVNKGTVYGIFYAGVALFGAGGSTVIGLIWKHFGEANAVLFSLGGLSLVGFVYLVTATFGRYWKGGGADEKK